MWATLDQSTQAESLPCVLQGESALQLPAAEMREVSGEIHSVPLPVTPSSASHATAFQTCVRDGYFHVTAAPSFHAVLDRGWHCGAAAI
jgi:hypothetical protein